MIVDSDPKYLFITYLFNWHIYNIYMGKHYSKHFINIYF